jgi:dihydropyrimidine dehydrogenase (NAD+) subunit PreT
MSQSFDLPSGRLEEQFKDKRPRYTEGEAVVEANRCIYCVDAPCVNACPTGIDIPTFIHKIATGNTRGAARTILDANLLGTSCARVCPVEVLCVGDCVYNHWGREPINIGRLQRFATETALEQDRDLIKKKKVKEKSGKRVALIGAGPASLACAGYLSLMGHEADIFEKREIPGGLNTTGIAPYKMASQGSVDELNWLLELGDIEIKTGVAIDEKSAIALSDRYDAVFIGIGLGADSKLGLDGEEGEGVYGAVDIIERLKLDPKLTLDGVGRAVVVGGGNTAIDIAHELAILGVPEVYMAYRRGFDRLSAYSHEIEWGRVDGVRVRVNAVPTGFERNDDGSLKGIMLADAEGGRAMEGTDKLMEAQLVAVAIGQARLTELAKAYPGVELDDKGRVKVDETTYRTGHAKVYAGGDCVNGGKEVVNAVQHGKLAAKAMHAAFTS